MGLLNKIVSEHAVEVPRPAGKQVMQSSVDDGGFEPAAPCLFCGSPTFWRSAYGGPMMCAVCDPWSARAMVGERWTIRTMADGSLEWVPCLQNGERASDREAAESVIVEAGIEAKEIVDEDGTWLRLKRKVASG